MAKVVIENRWPFLSIPNKGPELHLLISKDIKQNSVYTPSSTQTVQFITSHCYCFSFCFLFLIGLDNIVAIDSICGYS